jgi:hypothetical protein
MQNHSFFQLVTSNQAMQSFNGNYNQDALYCMR